MLGLVSWRSLKEVLGDFESICLKFWKILEWPKRDCGWAVSGESVKRTCLLWLWQRWLRENGTEGSLVFPVCRDQEFHPMNETVEWAPLRTRVQALHWGCTFPAWLGSDETARRWLRLPPSPLLTSAISLLFWDWIKYRWGREKTEESTGLCGKRPIVHEDWRWTPQTVGDHDAWWWWCMMHVSDHVILGVLSPFPDAVTMEMDHLNYSQYSFL